jgi:FdhD protein
MSPLPIITYTPLRICDGRCEAVPNRVCREVPLTIRTNGAGHATLMRTPGQERELAIGFCFTDQLILAIEEVTEVTCTTDTDTPYVSSVDVRIPHVRSQDVQQRSLLKSSSAAVHSRQILEDLLTDDGRAAGGRLATDDQEQAPFELAVLDELPEKLNACQVLRAQCGATHAAMLVDRLGTVLCSAEDVGRHNALDKVIGTVLLQRIATTDTILVLSSRASFEMIQKAARLAIPVVASVSAPTDLALRVAQRLGRTYLSFLKQGGYYLYTHPWRFGLTA